MSRLLLPITAALSVAIAAVLALGYVGYFGFDVYDWRPAGNASRFVSLILAVEEGRVQGAWSSASGATAAAGMGRWGPGRHLDWRGYFRWRLDARRILWEMNVRAVTAGNVSVHSFRASIWCFELPCLIAPLLWLRARRRRAKPVGFAVIASEAEQPSDDSDTAAPI